MFQKKIMKGTAFICISLSSEKKNEKKMNIYSAECISKSLNVVKPPTGWAAPSNPAFWGGKNENFNAYFWQSITFPES